MVARKDMDAVWAEYVQSGKQNEELRNQLVEAYLPYVETQVRDMMTRFPKRARFEETLSDAILGLFDAIEKFEPERGIKFETFCTCRVRGSVLDILRQADWTPRLVRKAIAKMKEGVRDLEIELGRPPSHEELRSRLEVSGNEYQEILDHAKRVKMTALPKLEDGREAEALFDHSRASARTRAIASSKSPLEEQESVDRLLNELPPKERAVLEETILRGRKLKEVAKELGLTESRVCQIRGRTLQHLREKLA